MKIGIFTFHWATNYGAILQAYALQTYLEKKGHSVDIINYKPLQFDYSIKSYLVYPDIFFRRALQFFDIRRETIKEKQLEVFRKKYLHLTKRFFYSEEINEIVGDYDIFISGSDQVLNPYFTTQGERKPTSVYFLNFPCKIPKIGYAVSFGCTMYPDKPAKLAKQWINNFQKIGTRESTGVNILEQIKYEKEVSVVPDPTVLCGKEMFSNLNLKIGKGQYTYVYMLRKRTLPSDYIAIDGEFVRYADSDARKACIEQWLEWIGSANHIITNSYHGMIMALLFHVPFVVLLESEENVGMNDRFFTLLSRLNLLDRIAENKSESINNVLLKEINWTMVDREIDLFRKVGESFLAL